MPCGAGHHQRGIDTARRERACPWVDQAGSTGLSKDDLAQLANVSVSTLNRMEDAGSAVRPRYDTVMAVRRALEEAGA
nr:helix-turn-helix domain-containing protein [Methylobacterium sp. E-046]